MKKNKIFALLLFALPAPVLAYADFFEYLVTPAGIEKENISMREINLKAGFDFSGFCDANKEITDTGLKSLSAGNNISFAAEYYRYFSPYTAFGAGAAAQMPRWLEDVNGKFGFIPVYIGFKVRSWPQEPGMYGYVFGHLGYNFYFADSSFKDRLKIKEGGIYYGFGLGIVYQKFLLEALYAINSGVVEDRINAGSEVSFDYSKWTISIGYTI